MVVSDFLGDSSDPTGSARCGRWPSGTTCSPSRCSTRSSWACPAVGLLTLVDPETGRLLEVQTGKKELRESYAEAAVEQRAEIAAALRRAGAAHLQLRTDRDWLVDMVRFVAARRRGASGGALR